MRTPLHRSAYNGHVTIVDYLISHGADIDSKDSDGRKPFHLALLKGHYNVVEYLIRKGSNINDIDNWELIMFSRELLFT